MLIELTDVRKAFNQGKPNEFWAIQGITTQFEVNRISCLKGASGSGKTTLMSMIGCLSRTTSGRIRLHDHTISAGFESQPFEEQGGAFARTVHTGR
ncbi:MAG: ATP-binding cassette domain-containing protein [Candidatus Thiodiazotropha taylori]